MWIVLAIVAFLAALITVIVHLPVKIIIKNDDDNALILRYKFLFKTYGENPDPNDPIVQMLKRLGGVERLEKTTLKQNVQSDGLQKTVTESYSVLLDLVKEVVGLLKRCTVATLQIKILSAGEDASQAAIRYGQYCAATHSRLGVLRSCLKVRKRGCDIDISCDFLAEKSVFRYNVVLVIGFGRVLAGFWRAVLAEAKRMAAEQQPQQK